jgi:CrcB protein
VKLLWYVALGSALGGVARFALAGAVQQRLAADFPGGTLFVNVTGSLLLGLFMGYALQSASIGPEMRLFLTTGFCGGYTTFSTFTYETARLIEDSAYGRATWYVGSSLIVSLVAMFMGLALAHWLIALRSGT